MSRLSIIINILSIKKLEEWFILLALMVFIAKKVVCKRYLRVCKITE